MCKFPPKSDKNDNNEGNLILYILAVQWTYINKFICQLNGHIEMYMRLLQHVSSVIYTPIQRHMELKCNFVDIELGGEPKYADTLFADIIHSYCNSILVFFFKLLTVNESSFGGLEVACCPLVPKFAGSNPAEAVRFFRAKKSSARLPSEGK